MKLQKILFSAALIISVKGMAITADSTVSAQVVSSGTITTNNFNFLDIVTNTTSNQYAVANQTFTYAAPDGQTVTVTAGNGTPTPTYGAFEISRAGVENPVAAQKMVYTMEADPSPNGSMQGWSSVNYGGNIVNTSGGFVPPEAYTQARNVKLTINSATIAGKELGSYSGVITWTQSTL